MSCRWNATDLTGPCTRSRRATVAWCDSAHRGTPLALARGAVLSLGVQQTLAAAGTFVYSNFLMSRSSTQAATYNTSETGRGATKHDAA